MAKGISIGIASDTREFATGVKKGVIEPLEDASDALEAVAKDGDKAGKKLEAAFDDARKETSEFKKEQSELGKAMARASEQGGAALKKNTKESTSAAKRDLKELGNEAKANAAETFSSFDGSMESFADGIQGTFGGIVSNLSPLGAAAGAAGALGIGLLMAGLEQAGEDTEAYKEQVRELADEFITTGEGGRASLGYIADQLKAIATESDEGKVSLAKVRREAADLKVPFKELAQTYAGGTDKIDEQIEHVQELIDEHDRQYRESVTQHSAYDTQAAAKSQKLEEQKSGLERVRDATAEARQQEADWLAAGGPELERKAQLIETVDQAYDDAAGAATDYISAESGLFDTGAYISAMQAKEQALKDYQETLATSPLTAAAKSFLDSQGAESAATFLAGYKSATPEHQRELERIWNEAGSASSGSYTAALKAGIPTEVAGPLVRARGDASDAIAEMQRQIDNHPFVARVATKFDRVGNWVP